MKQQNQAYIFALAAVLLWSTVATAFKLSLRYMEPVQLLFFSSLVSVGVLGIIILVQGKVTLLLSYSLKQYLYTCSLGILNPFLYYLILFKAYDLLPAQEAQPLNYTWALTMTLLSIPLLKQKVGIYDFLAGIICYTGVLVISTRGDLFSLQFSNPLGVGLALGSTIFWALYWIYNAKDRCDPVVGLFCNFIFAVPFIAIYCCFTTGFEVKDIYGYYGAIYVGCCEMGFTFVLWLKALKYTEDTSKIANLIFLSPFLSLVFIYFILGEKILWSSVFGLLLIIFGLIVQQTKKLKTVS